MVLLELGVLPQRNKKWDLETMRPRPHIYMFFKAQESRLLFSFESPNFLEM
ncbi:MAG: hypothetical protein RL127_1481 [Bacteroidota bacterium]|jgi:hypothetical protein